MRKKRQYERELHEAARKEFEKRYGHANYKRHLLKKIKNELRWKK